MASPDKRSVNLYSLKFCETRLHQVPELQNEITAGGVLAFFIESDTHQSETASLQPESRPLWN